MVLLGAPIARETQEKKVGSFPALAGGGKAGTDVTEAVVLLGRGRTIPEARIEMPLGKKKSTNLDYAGEEKPA